MCNVLIIDIDCVVEAWYHYAMLAALPSGAARARAAGETPLSVSYVSNFR
jgi:hypothetical protein